MPTQMTGHSPLKYFASESRHYVLYDDPGWEGSLAHDAQRCPSSAPNISGLEAPRLGGTRGVGRPTSWCAAEADSASGPTP